MAYVVYLFLMYYVTMCTFLTDLSSLRMEVGELLLSHWYVVLILSLFTDNNDHICSFRCEGFTVDFTM